MYGVILDLTVINSTATKERRAKKSTVAPIAPRNRDNVNVGRHGGVTSGVVVVVVAVVVAVAVVAVVVVVVSALVSTLRMPTTRESDVVEGVVWSTRPTAGGPR